MSAPTIERPTETPGIERVPGRGTDPDPEDDEESIDLDWLIEWSMSNAGPRQYGNGIYSFKADPDDEHCLCADTSRWPVPQQGVRVLPPTTRIDLYDESGEYVGYEEARLD
jgi:hypothetical protein